MNETSRREYYTQIKDQNPNLLKNLNFSEFCRELYYHPVGEHKRLKQRGFMIFKSTYPHYVVKIIDGPDKSLMPSKHFIFLARYCKSPYYIGSDQIVFFDEQEAFVFKMCDGNIDNVKSAVN